MRMAAACTLASLGALSKDDCLGASKNEVADGYRFESRIKHEYGETTSHMVAKNGYNEAAWLLISHGDSTEAKANNEMNPLHFSVWHSLRAEDSSTVGLFGHPPP
ncbi:cfxQ like protein [Tanacetum coccineum]